MQTVIGIHGELRIYGLLGPCPARPLSEAALQAALRTGRAVLLHAGANLITNVGLDALAALWGGAVGAPTVGGNPFGPPSLSALAPREMRVTAQVAPTAPTGGDTALEGSTLFSAEIEGGTLFVTYPAAAQVRYSAILSQLEQVGTTFTEEGLFNGAGDLLARTTFSRLHAASLNLQFNHTFTMARA